MRRVLEEDVRRDVQEKIVLLSGPRQVGKTTLSRDLGLTYDYLNFDAAKDRKIIREGLWSRDRQIVIFDELHKMRKWKSWVKGVFDTEKRPPHFLITGSARLDAYRKGGDSLAGRHFLYRLHPITVKEAAPLMDSRTVLDRLLSLGGFPEPFLKNDAGFAKRWRRRHLDTVLREDLLDLERVRDIRSIEILVELLSERVGGPVSYSSLAEDLQVSIPTVKHWLQILESLFVIFSVRPYHRNIARSLLKEAKYYFFDAGAVQGDEGARLENTVAANLLAELHLLEDTTGSKTALHYLRDREKREVDFCLVVDRKPVQIIEVKWADEAFSPHLFHFRKQLPGVSAFQLVYKAGRAQTKDGVRLLPPHPFLGKWTPDYKPSPN